MPGNYVFNVGITDEVTRSNPIIKWPNPHNWSAANEQNVDVNEFFIAAFEQNGIPVPDLEGEDDDLETELNRATEMMEEMEEMLGEE